jgi:hypothetical protein
MKSLMGCHSTSEFRSNWPHGGHVRTALNILNGLGNFEAAEAAREWAIALVAPRQARSMVASTLAEDDA